MSYVEMVVLTASAKRGKYCVSGKELKTGRWIRLMSDDEDSNGGLSDYDLSYQTGNQCKVLDLIGVECKDPVPTSTQPENILMDQDCWIDYLGCTTITQVVEKLPDKCHEDIYGNTFGCIGTQELQYINHSLMMVKGKKLLFHRETNCYGKSKLKVDFTYLGKRYEDLAVTDQEFFKSRSGDSIEDAYMVISMGEPYRGYCYKFVSKIFISE